MVTGNAPSSRKSCESEWVASSAKALESLSAAPRRGTKFFYRHMFSVAFMIIGGKCIQSQTCVREEGERRKKGRPCPSNMEAVYRKSFTLFNGLSQWSDNPISILPWIFTHILGIPQGSIHTRSGMHRKTTGLEDSATPK